MTLSSGHSTITLNPGPTSPSLVTLNHWVNTTAETLPAPFHWHLTRKHASTTEAQLIYESKNPHLRLSWLWRVRSAPGPIEHLTQIQNLSTTAATLDVPNSLLFDFQTADPLTALWIEKGVSAPSDVGTHSVPIPAGFQWTGTSSTYAHPFKGEQREMIPYLLVQRASDGFYLGIEFSGRTRIHLNRAASSVSVAAGAQPFQITLQPGEVFETPTVFLGTFQGAPDDAGNILKPWIRRALNHPHTLNDPQYPLLVSNSWGSGMAINEQQAHRMIDDAAALGLEMFHLDAGWFPQIGDWSSSPEKFPSGVAATAAYAHKLGLRFGLWTDWTQAGLNNINDPQVHQWLTTIPPPGWKPEELFKGITVDIGVPAARDWAAARMTKLISETKLDMLEHDGYLVAQGCDRTDHPHAPLDPAQARHFKDEGYLWVDGPNSSEVSYRAARAYYSVQAQLHKQFPNLLFEICNDGGRMVDFGSATYGDYFSITDAYDPLSNRREFYDTSWILPPAMLETYVEKVPTPTIENFRYMLRSGMMGWFSLMLDSNTWTAEQHAAAKAEFALYKHEIRPLIREANLYHVSDRPTAEHWDGLEYFNPASQRGMLFAFHGASLNEPSHTFVMKGLQPAATYAVTFQDHTSPAYTATGAQLMTSGVTVKSPSANSSELVFVRRNKS